MFAYLKITQAAKDAGLLYPCIVFATSYFEARMVAPVPGSLPPDTTLSFSFA